MGTVTTDVAGNLEYIVVTGDATSTIAARFGVDPAQVETLKSAKVGLSNIYPGEVLTFGKRGYT